MTLAVPEALYFADGESAEGELFVPSELTRGPWDPGAQHGGPPSALLARSIERFENDGGMLVTRVSVELLRPVPLTPLLVRTRLERPGKRVQLVVASLFSGTTEVARATGLRMRRAQVDLGELPPDGLPPPAPPETGVWSGPERKGIHFGAHGVEHRFVRGAFNELGPATDWIRLTRPLVAGEETHPLSRVMAAADFGNGVSAVKPFDGSFLYINADLGVYLHREPIGEWFCLEAQSYLSPLGIGLAESRLWDARGVLGRSLQSLLVDRGG
jgi:hypothetical protein